MFAHSELSTALGYTRDLAAGAAGAATAVHSTASEVAAHLGANPLDTFEKLTITVGGAVVSTLFVRAINWLFGLLRKK